jgi:hypothetical protein
MPKIHAVARTDLDHASGQPGECAIAVLGGAAPFGFGADSFLQPREPRMLES